MKLIHGVFFQGYVDLSVVQRSETEGGAAQVMMLSGTARYTFSGVLFPGANGIQGEMVDHFGDSFISSVIISGDSLRYDKQYPPRRDVIHYTYQRVGDLWIGGYTGKATGDGGAKCVLVDVPDDFFLPPSDHR